MNKLVKVMGMSAIITSAMFANAVISRNSVKTESPAAKEVSITTDDANNNLNSVGLWGTLSGLSLLGLAGVTRRYKKYEKEASEAEIQDLISASTKMVCTDDKTDKEQKCRILDSNFSLLNLLIKRQKITDAAAFAQFGFSFGALKHAVEHNDYPGPGMEIKLKYLAQKAFTPKNKFKPIDKQYRKDYPDINFDRHYGLIKYTKPGTYKMENENVLLYKGLSNYEIMDRISKIKEKIYDDRDGILMYKHDLINLKMKIRVLESGYHVNNRINADLLPEINDFYLTHQLKRNIDA